jgi:putative PEP-CTERM system TPR-repeat lipoprotein
MMSAVGPYRVAGAAIVLFMMGACAKSVAPTDRLERAEKLAAAGEVRAALIELNQVTKQDPGNVRAVSMSGDAYLRLGNVAAARRLLDEASQTSLWDPALQQLELRVRLAEGRFEDVLAALEAEVGARAEAQSALLRGDALYGLGKYSQADESYAAAVRSGAGEEARIRWARARLGHAGPVAALAVLPEETTQTSASIFAARGDIQLAAGDLTGAERSLAKAAARIGEIGAPQSEIALMVRLAQVRLQLNDSAGAESVIDVLQQRAGEAPVVFLLRANLHAAQGDLERAVEAGQKLANVDPDNVGAMVLLGRLLAQQKAYGSAEMYLSRAVARLPDNAEAAKLLAQVQLAQKRPLSAASTLRALIETGYFDAESIAMYSNVLRASGESAWMERVSTQLDALQPSADRDLALAVAHILNGDASKALSLLAARQEWGELAKRRQHIELLAATATNDPAKLSEAAAKILQDPNVVPQDHLLASAVAMHMGDTAAAADYLERGLTRFPGSSALVLQKVGLLAGGGQYSAASDVLAAHVERHPEDQAAWRLRARVAWVQGNLEEALAHSDKAVALAGRAPAPRVELANLLARSGRYEEARRVLNEGLTANSNSPTLLLALGDLELASGEASRGLAAYRRAIELDAGSTSLRVRLARAYLLSGDTKAALREASAAVDAEPESIEAIAVRTEVDLRAGRPQEALRRIAQAEMHGEPPAGLLVLKARTLAATGAWRAGAELLEQGAERTGDGSLVIAAYRLRRNARDDAAAEGLKRWLQRQPSDINARLSLSEHYSYQNDRAAAVSELQAALKYSPLNPVLLNNLAWLYHESGDERALDMARQAAQAAPGLAETRDTVGWILASQGRLEEAIVHLNAAHALAPDNRDIAYHLASALVRAGAVDRARLLLETALHKPGASEASRVQVQQLLSELHGR